ncbi:MAG: Uma2 family endonuclease [Luteitalea sp.]|nr:Uma2 family endonuclease [Luteitalea sp.]
MASSSKAGSQSGRIMTSHAASSVQGAHMPTQAATYVDAIRHLPAGSTLIIPDVSWAEYEQLLADLGEGYAVRLTYDQGRLEIMSPSSKHGKYTAFVLLLGHVLASELKTSFESFGSTTFKEPALKQGAEPDTCFYVQHAAQVVGKDDLDLAVDPPPDVVVEIDVSHSSARKLAFYAKLGVPEVWRFEEPRASMYHLTGTDYTEAQASLAFPAFTADMLTALLHQISTEGQQAVLEAFGESLRHRT